MLNKNKLMFLNSELEAEMELSFQMTDRSRLISDDRPEYASIHFR